MGGWSSGASYAAASHNHDGTHDAHVWVSAGAMGLTSGSPSLADVGGDIAPAWLMDAAGTEIVAGSLYVPPSWTTASFKMYWTNAGAGAGDVVWSASYTDGLADGDSIATGEATLLGDTAVTAPAESVLDIYTLNAGIAVTASQALSFRIARKGANVADTLVNDAGIVGVLIQRVT